MVSFILSGWALLRKSFLARLVAVSLTALIALKSYGVYQQQVGANKVVENSRKAGDEINRANREKRKQASMPGAHKRLLEKYCRDCDG